MVRYLAGETDARPELKPALLSKGWPEWTARPRAVSP